MEKYEAGILLPIFSIPSRYGIGSFGSDTKKFIDFVYNTKNKYLQILPLGEIGYGASPYSSISNYAGSINYIDLDELVKDNLLTSDEVKEYIHDTKYVDYEYLASTRLILLRLAFSRFDKTKLDSFIKENKTWVIDFAIYMVLKNINNGLPWNKWTEGKIYKDLDKEKFIKEHEEDVNYYIFTQYLFFKQWFEIKNYANSLGIKIIGDVPIYSSFDSVDVWSNTKEYLINEDYEMEVVSGCPPDSFSKDGQVWNNPIYNYSLMEKDNYKYLVDKFSHNLKLFDIVRLDHFRGYESYYSVLNGATNGKNGKWAKAPGMKLFSILNNKFGSDKFIAEDLGFLTEEVEKLLDDTAYPGMRVLEFGFDGDPANKYLTRNYKYDTVAYIGTHDNNPIKGWLREKITYNYVSKYYEVIDRDRIVDVMINDVMSSISKLVIIQLQDYMHQGSSSRINTPGTVGENWCYRLPNDYNKESLREYIIGKVMHSSRN